MIAGLNPMIRHTDQVMLLAYHVYRDFPGARVV